MQRRTKSIFSCNTDLIVCLTDKICSTGKEHTITGCGLSATESLVCDDCVCTVWSITLFNLFRRKRKVKCQHYLVEISQCGLMNKKIFFWIWWLSYLVDQGGRKQALLSGVELTAITFFPTQEGQRGAIRPLPALRRVQLVKTDPHPLGHLAKAV